MMRWLVRFGYAGDGFAGSARQPGLRTVEGELLAGLSRARIAEGPRAGRCDVASRTDRGVSARANAFTLSSNLRGPALLRALNGISPDIFCSAATPVPEEFRVRRAVRRVYRYHEPPSGFDFERRARAALLFSGRIDVRSFARGLPQGVPCFRDIESVSVSQENDGYVIEVRAPSFVWGMVRKIVSALRAYDSGRVSIADLESALRGRSRLAFPLAEPEGLILWEVEYPFSWEFEWSGPNRHQVARSRSAFDALWMRSRVLQALTEATDR